MMHLNVDGHATFPNKSTNLSWGAICSPARCSRSCCNWLAWVIFTSADYKPQRLPESHDLMGIEKKKRKEKTKKNMTKSETTESCATDFSLIGSISARPEMLVLRGFAAEKEEQCLLSPSGSRRRCLLSVPCWRSPWFRLQKGQNFGSLVLWERAVTNLGLLSCCWCCWRDVVN